MIEIKKIKVHEVLTCKIEDSVENVAKKMKESKERRIFVVDKNRKLEGIITSTDLVYRVLAESKKGLKAGDIMTKDVRSVDVSDNLEKALSIMNELKTFSCPITDKRKIIGLLSYHDIVNHVISNIEK